jgi:hypothetical protein
MGGLLKELLRDPTRGFRQGLEIGDMFRRRAQQQRDYELAQQKFGLDRDQHGLNEAKFAASEEQRPRDNMNTAAQLAQNLRSQNWKEGEADRTAKEIDLRAHATSLGGLDQYSGGTVPSELAAMNPTQRAAFLAQRNAGRQRSETGFEGSKATARENAGVKAHAAKGAITNNLAVEKERALLGEQLGRYSPPQWTPNAAGNFFLRTQDPENEYSPEIQKEGSDVYNMVKERLSRGRGPVSQTQSRELSREELKAKIQAKEITLDMVARDPALKALLARHGLIKE